MYKNLRQLFKETQETRLSADEKAFIRYTLEKHVRNSVPDRQQLYRSNKPLFNLNFKPMPILIAILIALGGGTSFAAQNALPGDTLYTVKTSINEPVQGLLSMSAEAKANWEAVLANRRLNEAEQLAAEGKLNTTTSLQLENNFEDHANKSQELITKLAEKDPQAAADIASNFQASLQAHSRILNDIGVSKDGDIQPLTQSLSASVKSEGDDALQNDNQIEADVRKAPDVQAAAQGRMTAAQNKIDEVTKFIGNRQTKLGVDGTEQAQAQMKIATDLFAQGQAALTAQNFAQAFTLFGQAQAKAQQVQLLVDAKANFDNDEVSQTASPTTSPRTSVSPNPSGHGNDQNGNDGNNSGDGGDGGHNSARVHINLELH